VGQVTFSCTPDTLFRAAANVSVRFEENPLFATAPTVDIRLRLHPIRSGTATSTSSPSPSSSAPPSRVRPSVTNSSRRLIAGVNRRVRLRCRAARGAGGATSGANPGAPARLRLDGEFATSRPHPRGRGSRTWSRSRARADSACRSPTPRGYLSSPAGPRARNSRRAWAAPPRSNVTRAATLAWQNNGLNFAAQAVSFTLPADRPAHDIVGARTPAAGAACSGSRSTALDWRRLARRHEEVPVARAGAPAGRRWRSIRQSLGPLGHRPLARGERGVLGARRHRRSCAAAGTRRSCSTSATSPRTPWPPGPRSSRSSRPAAAPTRASPAAPSTAATTLQSERDRSRAPSIRRRTTSGSPADVLRRLPFTSPAATGCSRASTCARAATRASRGSATRAPTAPSATAAWTNGISTATTSSTSTRRAGEAERLFRYVVDLGDSRRSRAWAAARCRRTTRSGARARGSDWVLVRVPFAAAADTLNGGPSVRRVRAMRLTVVSGEGMGDGEFTQLPIARLRLVGAPWLKRADRTMGRNRRRAHLPRLGGARASSARRTRTPPAGSCTNRRPAWWTRPTRSSADSRTSASW